MNRLSLFIPGLLGPMPELEESGETLSSCLTLEEWLARGDLIQTGRENYPAELAHLLGLDPAISSAQLCALADGLYQPGEHILRADPVHFQADLDNARLFGGERMKIGEDEAQALVDAFNQHFADDDLQLCYRHPTRWYLKSSRPLAVNTVAIHDALSRNVQAFLPGGDDELFWRKILNEAQMLFFSHPVNEQRTARGEPAINSLWLWGEGRDIDAARDAATPSTVDMVLSEEPTARGMALLLGMDCARHYDWNQPPARECDHALMVVDDAYLPMAAGDLPVWSFALHSMCSRWIGVLNAAFSDKRFQQIDLYSGDGRCYSITPRRLKKFWRRRRPLAHHINTHA